MENNTMGETIIIYGLIFTIGWCAGVGILIFALWRGFK